jgi:hypothetical protein
MVQPDIRQDLKLTYRNPKGGMCPDVYGLGLNFDLVVLSQELSSIMGRDAGRT